MALKDVVVGYPWYLIEWVWNAAITLVAFVLVGPVLLLNAVRRGPSSLSRVSALWSSCSAVQFFGGHLLPMIMGVATYTATIRPHIYEITARRAKVAMFERPWLKSL